MSKKRKQSGRGNLLKGTKVRHLTKQSKEKEREKRKVNPHGETDWKKEMKEEVIPNKERERKTRQDTRVPKSRAGGQGPYLRSQDHLGRSSEVKESRT